MIQNIGGQKPVGRGLTAGGAAGLAGIGMLAGGLMQQSDNEGMQMAGSALSGAGQGAMMGMMFGPIGAGIGAAIGGLGSLLMAHQKKQEEREAKEAKLREEAKAGEKDAYTMMEEHLRVIAEKELSLKVDGNEMSTQLNVSKSQLGSS
jgi:gas vesicle protein